MGRELPTNFVWRGRKIYLRVRIPDDVAHAFGGKTDKWKSLNTSDPKLAKQAGIKAMAEMHMDWQRIRESVPVPSQPHEMTEADVERAAGALYRSELEADQRHRERLPTAADVDAERTRLLRTPANDPHAMPAIDFAVFRDQAVADQKRRVVLLSELKRHLGTGEISLVAWAADAAIVRESLKVDRGSPAYRRLSQALMRAWIQALERTLERDRGDFTGMPADPLLTPAPVAPVAPAPAPAPPGETILELFDKYAKINPTNIKPDTLAYGRVAMVLFTQTLPPGSGVRAITKAAVREWHDLLRKLPIRATDFSGFRGLNIREIIAANERLGRPVLTRRTINKHVTSLASFCRWLEKRGYIDSNPASGFHEALDHTTRKIRPYTTPELQKLFTSPVFTGCRSDARDYEPGELRLDDWRKWLPLMGLFTGARLGELCQLSVDDLRQEHGHWIFRITGEGDGQTLKNKQSERIVPVHAELIRLGLLDYHARIVARGEKQLFPELKPDARNFNSGTASRWFGKYLIKIGLKTDKLVNFHSFRHGMADALRGAGYLDSDIAFLLGHKSQGTKITRGYGAISEGTLARRVEMMSKVSFPNLI